MRLPRFLLIVLVVGCAPAAAAQSPPEPDWPALGRRFIEQLAAQQFDQATATFDAAMKNALPTATLAATWSGLAGKVGALQGITGARVETKGAYHVVLVTCQFEKTALDAQVSFDREAHIAGLHFLPAGPKVAWSPAADVRPDLRERAITVGAAPWELPGTLTLPAGSGPHPAVVLVHGSGPNDEDETIGPNKPFKDLALGLASRGVAVVRYVKRTAQYATQLKLDSHFTVAEETVDDARAAVALAARQPEIDPRRIYVLGHSLGGMLAPRIAQSDPQVAGLVIMAGSTRPLEQIIVAQIRYLASLNPPVADAASSAAAQQAAEQIESPGLTASSVVKLLGIDIPGSYFLDLRGYHPEATAAALPIPMLILQAGRDYQVTTDDLTRWQTALGRRRDVTFKNYPGLFHLFMPSKTAGTGLGTPADYEQAGHVESKVIADIAGWVGSQSARQP
jgi:dienelactone hydrolase